MLPRRTLVLAPLAATLAGATVGCPAQAQPRRALADPLRLGVDTALADSGLARALQQAFGRDTGLAVLVVAKPALALLGALERGEVDAGLCNAPDAETKLVKLRGEVNGATIEHQDLAGLAVSEYAAALGFKITPAPIATWLSLLPVLLQYRSTRHQRLVSRTCRQRGGR